MSRRGVRVGIDVGGTFIDLVLERADGTLHSEKVLSEPHDLIGAICAGLSGRSPARVRPPARSRS